jgi:hypothetical protein
MLPSSCSIEDDSAGSETVLPVQLNIASPPPKPVAPLASMMVLPGPAPTTLVPGRTVSWPVTL